MPPAFLEVIFPHVNFLLPADVKIGSGLVDNSCPEDGTLSALQHTLLNGYTKDYIYTVDIFKPETCQKVFILLNCFGFFVAVVTAA